MTRVVDPDEPRQPGERWLRVVRDEDRGPGSADPNADTSGAPDGDLNRPPDAGPTGVGGGGAYGVLGDGASGAPGAGPDDDSSGAPSVGRAAGRAPGTWARPTARQTWSPAATGGGSPAGSADDSSDGPYRESAGRSAADGPGHRIRLGRAVLTVAAVVAIGTAGALAADRLVGRPGDGHPPLYLLVALALPFWDALPARLGPRVAVVTAVAAAVAAGWFGLSLLHEPAWWRAEVSFGLACLGVGVAHLLIAAALRRR